MGAIIIPVIVTFTYGIKKVKELAGHGGKSNMLLDPSKMNKQKTELLLEIIMSTEYRNTFFGNFDWRFVGQDKQDLLNTISF